MPPHVLLHIRVYAHMRVCLYLDNPRGVACWQIHEP